MLRFPPVRIAASVLLAGCLFLLQRRDNAPANLPKDAASFDLPIALGVLAGSGQFASEWFDRYAVVGELALDGTTRPTKGALSMAMAAAQHNGLVGIFLLTESQAIQQCQDGPSNRCRESRLGRDNSGKATGWAAL